MAKYRTAHSKEDCTKAIDCAAMHSTILLVSDSGITKHLISKEYPHVKIFENKILHVDEHTNVTEVGMLGIWQEYPSMPIVGILAQSHVHLKCSSTHFLT